MDMIEEVRFHYPAHHTLSRMGKLTLGAVESGALSDPRSAALGIRWPQSTAPSPPQLPKCNGTVAYNSNQWDAEGWKVIGFEMTGSGTHLYRVVNRVDGQVTFQAISDMDCDGELEFNNLTIELGENGAVQPSPIYQTGDR